MRSEGLQKITSGSATTLSNGAGVVFVDPASTLATHTITLAAAPSDRDIVRIYYGGTLTAGTVVTLLTIQANSGHTIVGTAITAAATLFSDAQEYQFRRETNQWYRFK